MYSVYMWKMKNKSIASLGGRGAQLWRHPGSAYLGDTSIGHLV